MNEEEIRGHDFPLQDYERLSIAPYKRAVT